MVKEGLFEQKTSEMRRCQLWEGLEARAFHAEKLRSDTLHWDGASAKSFGCDGLVILKNVKNEVEVRREVFSDRALKINFQNLDFILSPMGELLSVFCISTLPTLI